MHAGRWGVKTGEAMDTKAKTGKNADPKMGHNCPCEHLRREKE
jgi:hypothetical protein